MRWWWDREETPQPEGVTRRHFLFLTGMTGAFVATGGLEGLTLLERPAITTAFDLRAANEILKRVYLPHVAAALNSSSILFTQLRGV